MRPALDSSLQSAYYEAALRALRFVEQRSPTTRRFGPDADARWNALKGHLGTIDRLELLLRDADAQWPASFSARTVFALRAVAEDDAFGSAWEPLDDETSESLWRSVLASPAPTNLTETFLACARAWRLSLEPFEPGPIAPADKLILAGPSAIVYTAAAFASRSDLSFSDQVLVVATPPAHRQLAALAGALLNATRAVPLVDAQASTMPNPGGRRLVLSNDADPADAAFARRLIAG